MLCSTVLTRSWLKQLGRYLLTSHCLGSGSFAIVHLAMDFSRQSSKQVACKIIKKKKDQKLEKLMKEVRILTGLDHVRDLFACSHILTCSHIFSRA